MEDLGKCLLKMQWLYLHSDVCSHEYSSKGIDKWEQSVQHYNYMQL